MRMFIAALVITAPNWKQPKDPSMDELITESSKQIETFMSLFFFLIKRLSIK